MRRRRTTLACGLVTIAVTTLTAACDGTQDPGAAGPPGTTSESAGPSESGGLPQFDGELEVRVSAALHVFGLGCRQVRPRDACTVDGSKTYTLVRPPRDVMVTRARMRLERSGGGWVVTVRFGSQDRRAVQREAESALGMGGYVVVLDAGTGDVLQAMDPQRVERGTVTLRDLDRPEAWDLVTTYISAADSR